MLTDGRNTYTWNSEDQLKTAAGVTYTYDGDGHRVEKSNGKLYWYGTGSDALMETDLSGNLTDEYVFFGGKRIARRDSSNNVVYYAADHLGTSRVIASSAGAILDQSDFYPFGGERVLSASSGNTYKFTSKERDTESNLDNFGARYDSSILGRFMSPDWSAIPAPVSYANLANPQTLNLYSYAGNNPITLGDPDGHCDFGCVFGIAMGIFNGIQRDGGVKPYLKNVGTGILKGAGSAAVNTAKLAAAGTNPGAITAAVMSPGPQALQPSNTTQAQASIITQTVLPAAAGMAAGPLLGGEAATASETTSLFRAVGSAEAGSIESTGVFSASPTGSDFKGFFFNEGDATSFASRLTDMTGDTHSVVSAEAPTDLVNASPVHNAATEGPGVLIENSNLPQVKAKSPQ